MHRPKAEFKSAKTLLIAKAWQKKAQESKAKALNGELAHEKKWRDWVINKNNSNASNDGEQARPKLSVLLSKHREALMKPINQVSLLQSWKATTKQLAKTEEVKRPALRSQMASTHAYL